MFARGLQHGLHLRLCNLMRIHTAQPFALRVNHHHDAERFGRLLVKNRFEHLDDEIHCRVVVVQQHHLVEIRLLRLLLCPLENLAVGLLVGSGHVSTDSNRSAPCPVTVEWC